ncbi:MAG: general secretion pathway protein GspK, partial [Candidatus Hydrogenedentes bacterium]|nr:general secretion pathway protein GspK [Candidatus Hydrogenedentota bacterium]
GEQADLELLREVDLPAETVRFIELYRIEGNLFTHPADLLEMQYTLKEDHAEYPQAKKGQTISSEVGAGQLPTVLDRLTVIPGGKKTPIFGLVNVNTAGAEVLAALSDIDENLARRIVSKRGSLDDTALGTPAWLYTEGLVDARLFKMVVRRVTSRGFQFRVRCVGFGRPSGQFRVLEVVVDLVRGPQRIFYVRDITRLGLPIAMDVSLETQTVGTGR